MLKFIICDDEQRHNTHIKRQLEKIISNHNLNAKVAFCSNNPHDILKYSQQHRDEKGNVYILDIDFKEKMDGVELAKKIRENEMGAYVIFISAHQEYSLVCYKIKTFDFLLKPVNYDILEQCILRLVKDFYYSENKTERTIAIKSGSEIHNLNVDDIYYCEKYGKILVVHTTKGTLRSYETLESIQEKLAKHGFFRCHKSFLINLKHVSHIERRKNLVYMANGDKCLISRNYKKELLSHFVGNV